MLLILIFNDYSTKLVVASTFAEVGWNVYFPHRNQGFETYRFPFKGHLLNEGRCFLICFILTDGESREVVLTGCNLVIEKSEKLLH